MSRVSRQRERGHTFPGSVTAHCHGPAVSSVPVPSLGSRLLPGRLRKSKSKASLGAVLPAICGSWDVSPWVRGTCHLFLERHVLSLQFSLPRLALSLPVCWGRGQHGQQSCLSRQTPLGPGTWLSPCGLTLVGRLVEETWGQAAEAASARATGTVR